MSRKPAVRTETPVERRLKLQLRRFITLERLACKMADKMYETFQHGDGWYELKKLNFALLSHKLQGVKESATTPQEKRLKAAYADMLQVVYAYRRGQYRTVGTNLMRLVIIAERVLHVTRKDKS